MGRGCLHGHSVNTSGRSGLSRRSSDLSEIAILGETDRPAYFQRETRQYSLGTTRGEAVWIS